MSEQLNYRSEKGIRHMQPTNPEEVEFVPRMRDPSASRKPCAATTSVIDSCSKAQFMYWVLYDRAFNTTAYRSEEQRFQCPMNKCRSIWPDLRQMLDHLRNCTAFAVGREYWCYECWQEETLPRRTDCLSKSRSLLGKLSSSIARSMHSKRGASESDSEACQSPAGPSRGPAEMFAWEEPGPAPTHEDYALPLYTPEAASCPVYEAASGERTAELPTSWMDSSSIEEMPAAPMPSRTGSGYSMYSVSQQTSFSVSPRSTMDTISSSTTRTSCSETSRHPLQRLSIPEQGFCSPITGQEMCDSPLAAGDSESWGAHAAPAAAESPRLDAVVSPLEQSPVTQHRQVSELPAEQVSPLCFERRWSAVDPRPVPSMPSWPMFAGSTDQSAMPSWEGQSSPQYIAPLRLRQNRQPEFPCLYPDQHPAELDGTPAFPGAVSAAAGSAAAVADNLYPVLPLDGAVIPPSEAGHGPMLFGLPSPDVMDTSPPKPRNSPSRKRRRPKPAAGEEGPAPLQCTHCDKKFEGSAVRKMFRRHLQRHQTVENIFVCGYKKGDGKECQKCYNREDNLVQHRRKEDHPLIGKQIQKLRERRHRLRGGGEGGGGSGDVPSPAPDPWQGITPLHSLPGESAMRGVGRRGYK